MVRLGMLPHKAFVDRDDEVSAKVLDSMHQAGDDATPNTLYINTSLPTRNDVMGNNENNSQLTQLLCTFNISENVEYVCCHDCMVRHDEADIMLPSYMLHAIVTLGTNHSVRIDGDDVQVDQLLLFQRLITVDQTSDELESAFKHELCSYPPALFDLSLLLREIDQTLNHDCCLSNNCSRSGHVAA